MVARKYESEIEDLEEPGVYTAQDPGATMDLLEENGFFEERYTVYDGSPQYLNPGLDTPYFLYLDQPSADLTGKAIDTLQAFNSLDNPKKTPLMVVESESIKEEIGQEETFQYLHQLGVKVNAVDASQLIITDGTDDQWDAIIKTLTNGVLENDN